jgi:hypothetical protein
MVTYILYVRTMMVLEFERFVASKTSKHVFQFNNTGRQSANHNKISTCTVSTGRYGSVLLLPKFLDPSWLILIFCPHTLPALDADGESGLSSTFTWQTISSLSSSSALNNFLTADSQRLRFLPRGQNAIV